jgi:hypothetical protein
VAVVLVIAITPTVVITRQLAVSFVVIVSAAWTLDCTPQKAWELRKISSFLRFLILKC